MYTESKRKKPFLLNYKISYKANNGHKKRSYIGFIVQTQNIPYKTVAYPKFPVNIIYSHVNFRHSHHAD